MGKKYIIELLDDCNSEFKGIMVFGLTQDKQISVELIPEESLTPYTEDSAYAHGYTEAESKYREIRDELEKQAYEKGVQDTKQHWIDAPRTCAYQLGYENGLNDAWEAARKLYLPIEYGGIPVDVLHQMFDNKSLKGIFMKVSASECIEKIRQYEQEKEEQIQVGDEVTTDSGKAVVTGVGPVFFEYVYADGSHGFDKVENVKKTGRHFPEISAVLQKMQMKDGDNE